MAETLTRDEMQPHLDNRRNWFGMAVCELIGDQKFDVATIFPMTLDVRINGLEVSFKELVAHMQSQFEEQVKFAAADLIKDQLSDISLALEKIENEAESLAKLAQKKAWRAS